jgi:hypothetical protein
MTVNIALCCFFIHFILSVSWYLLVVNKFISIPLMMLVFGFNTPILMLSLFLVRPIRFYLLAINYIHESIGYYSFN